jgi:hypothetical protein
MVHPPAFLACGGIPFVGGFRGAGWVSPTMGGAFASGETTLAPTVSGCFSAHFSSEGGGGAAGALCLTSASSTSSSTFPPSPSIFTAVCMGSRPGAIALSTCPPGSSGTSTPHFSLVSTFSSSLIVRSVTSAVVDATSMMIFGAFFRSSSRRARAASSRSTRLFLTANVMASSALASAVASLPRCLLQRARFNIVPLAGSKA